MRQGICLDDGTEIKTGFSEQGGKSREAQGLRVLKENLLKRSVLGSENGAKKRGG